MTDAAPDNLVEIRNLAFSRGERKIFDGVDVSIARGKVTAIMGPSGCGKTTLLRFIGGQLHPDGGEVRVNGRNVPSMGREELFRVRASMGMLFQSGALFTDLSVYENVAFPLRAHTRLSEPLIRELVLMKLESVGLRGAEALMPAELSGGMNRRAALARAIALDPELIMYDEPFAGQDPIVKGVLVTLIRTLREALGLTTVIVSHDIHETLSIADYIYVLADGKVIGQGTPAELQSSTSDYVRQFLQGEPDGPVRFRYPALGFAEELAALRPQGDRS
ncbi:MAG: ATP-binding cassette domain-containing protein [Moraxellaceae bacterium]|jgi:phospholipid/cholesterol/gamma-HCH transport system ATP-binding protein|nr:ATP-binding cassette domain-containing protein [Moraxellaceae bacterium]MBP7229807.1 ATP-binding cassette domain-containing protein [Moraxellaceae bacterium]MBP8851592.1 ATP-binding cassette domain-containing protein [Moraxellaceae bacterium]MBP9045338.1 ATP-binding cassette domain-containing protein [Moraxellaceae bacterium]MBP9730012.1 ATP-binding cassette domain-containing protein [Moraxellaceae bacterium]